MLLKSLSRNLYKRRTLSGFDFRSGLRFFYRTSFFILKKVVQQCPSRPGQISGDNLVCCYVSLVMCFQNLLAGQVSWEARVFRGKLVSCENNCHLWNSFVIIMSRNWLLCMTVERSQDLFYTACICDNQLSAVEVLSLLDQLL